MPPCVGKRLGVSRATIRRWWVSGQIPTLLRLGRMIRWDAQQFEARIAGLVPGAAATVRIPDQSEWRRRRDEIVCRAGLRCCHGRQAEMLAVKTARCDFQISTAFGG